MTRTLTPNQQAALNAAVRILKPSIAEEPILRDEIIKLGAHRDTIQYDEFPAEARETLDKISILSKQLAAEFRNMASTAAYAMFEDESVREKYSHTREFEELSAHAEFSAKNYVPPYADRHGYEKMRFIQKCTALVEKQTKEPVKPYSNDFRDFANYAYIVKTAEDEPKLDWAIRQVFKKQSF